MTSGATTLTDAIRFGVLYQLNNTHTSMPGTVLSYDPSQQRATIQPSINKSLTNGVTVVLPVLTNVPVIWPNSGGASITMPVLPGDTCLILFCERSIDDWITQGGNASGTITPSDPRKFDMSDGVAIMGLKPFNSTFPVGANNSDLLLKLGTAALALQPGGKVALGTNAIELLSQLSTVFTALANPASGLNGAARTACTTFFTNINTIKGTLP